MAFTRRQTAHAVESQHKWWRRWAPLFGLKDASCKCDLKKKDKTQISASSELSQPVKLLKAPSDYTQRGVCIWETGPVWANWCDSLKPGEGVGLALCVIETNGGSMQKHSNMLVFALNFPLIMEHLKIWWLAIRLFLMFDLGFHWQ